MLKSCDYEIRFFGDKSFWKNGADINAAAPPDDAEAIHDILDEIAALD
jgi:hypothetical protein